MNNLKSSSVDYINENIDNINWINDSEEDSMSETEFTCVSIIALVNYGYYTKDILTDDTLSLDINSYIKINRDINGKNILNEEIGVDADNICSVYYVKIPTCNNITYNGTTQNLIEVTDEYIVSDNYFQVNAGNYNLTLELPENSGYNWSDGQTGSTRTLTCSVNRKNITLKLNSLEMNDEEFQDNKYIGDIQTIMDNLTVAGLVNDHEISSLDISKNDEGTELIISNIKITNLDGTDVSSNYNIPTNVTGKLTLTNNTVSIPTTSICNNNLVYNGSRQVLASAPANVTLSNNHGTDAGNYNVIATINGDYKWSDGTTTAKTITCSIGKTDDSKLTLSDKTASYTGENVNFTISDVELLGINNTQITDLTENNIKFTYYTDENCTIETTAHSNIGTYYAKAFATNLNNYNDTTSNCASMELVNQTTVTYDPNGGSVNPTSKVIKTGDTYGTLPTPTRTGYTFDGWYTSASGGTEVTASTIITNTNSHTIYAHWQAKTVKVTFMRNTSSSDTASATQTFTYGESGNRFGYNTDGTLRWGNSGQFGWI